MTKLLYVEDDALVSRLYTQKLIEAGYDVTLAEDGLEAIRRLAEFRPDVVVLDLLLPKMNGADVLKFMREQPTLSDVPVIVFSNAFLSSLAQEAAASKVETALVKAAATPAELVATVYDVMHSRPAADAESDAKTAESVPIPVETRQAAVAVPETEVEFDKRVQKEFFEQTPLILKSLREICRKFIDAAEPTAELRRLEDLTRKVGFLAQMTALAGCHHLSQLASALEAMLYDLHDGTKPISDSSRHTIITAVAFLADQLEAPGRPKTGEPKESSILVVDDDAVSNRVVVQSLNRANLQATGVGDPFDALKQLESTPYDLVLLDVDMPGMDGITLCEQMRALPLHKHTPAVFVTGLTDFKTRARSLLASGNEIIAKPILSLELTVKVITQLLRSRLR